jgi:hypothetical protein
VQVLKFLLPLQKNCMNNKIRYFIVFYRFYNNTKGSNGCGYYDCHVDNGKYVPSKQCAENIKVLVRKSGNAKDGDDLNIIFTNIIELSPADYASWNS